MKHERDYSITLDEQVAKIKHAIGEGLETYPIDIVETTEKQVYYKLPAMVEPEMLRIHPVFSNNQYSKEHFTYELLKRIAKEINRPIFTAIQQQPPKKEMKVYLVELNDLTGISWIFVHTCSNDEFIGLSLSQGNAYSFQEYQKAINDDEISMKTKLIRFIEA